MRLCGISSRFQLLSPCMRQVTHALLTRPPLSHKIFISEENQIECFVRLACVKHAASVHPEPGSNSHVKKFFPARIIWQLIRNNVLIYCFKVVFLKDVRRKILSSIPLRSISLFGFRQIRPSSISDLQASLQLQFPQS